MDNTATISAVRAEYKEYLREQHPEWTDNTLKTHVSDAFYAYNHTLTISFWKSLYDEDSMQEAKNAIFDYLHNEIMSDRAEERTKAYYSDLCMLKEFLDSQYGGVKERIGIEYEAEKILYNYAKKVYDGTLSEADAIEAMCEEVPMYNATSHKLTLMLFPLMVEGKRYTRRANTESTIYFIRKIGEDYGFDKMVNALTATHENIKYYYEQSGLKSQSICRGCKKIAEEYSINLKFDDSMFEGIIPKTTTDAVLSDDKTGVRYWIYNAYNWEDLCREGIIVIGRDYLGDPMLYESKKDMQAAMKDCGTERYTTTYKNASLEVWQFVHDLKPGDIVFAKKGTQHIIGCGVIQSDFIYDDKKPTDFKYYRKINWTHIGEWQHPGKAVTKNLTDITSYGDYVKKLLALFEEQENDELSEALDESEKVYDEYTEEDFLKDVYMDEKQYKILKNLLLTKKNVILQGAPGVGKTFAAKRLAYSIMGEKDRSRVKMIQFHQSYSYEDFIMGFRPNESGFELKYGSFYEFCHKAAEDDREYFFIIDEINRGNLSKIFGELFMLIEADKRGVSLELLYTDEEFSIPSNVYIIGMMNTADRSLAMMDYALRRRFAFYNIEPAFASSGFRTRQKKIANDKFDKLIYQIEMLNEEIKNDDSLGEGFCIGHSYFCTDASVNDDWLESVVEYEIIPLLKEYWFDEPANVKKWEANLRSAIK